MKSFITLMVLLVSASAFAKRVPLTNDIFAKVSRENATAKLRLYVSEKVVSTYYSIDSDADIDRGIDFKTKEIYHKEILKKNRTGTFIEVRTDRRRSSSNRAYELWVSFDAGCSEKSCAYKFTRTDDGAHARFVVTRVPDQKHLRFKEIKEGRAAVLEFEQGLVRKIIRSKSVQGGVD